MSKGCPHNDVKHCPLYHAMHVPNGASCDDGKIDDGDCAVARGMNYARQVEKLRVQCPGLVEAAEWRKAIDARSGQQQRNLRMNGIH